MASSSPTLIFGSGTIGGERYAFKTAADVEALLSELKQLGIDRLDVTPRHPPGHNYLAETLYGQAGAVPKGFIIDVKNLINPQDTSGSLSAASLRASIGGSLERLGLDKANVFYAYAPDAETPLREQAAAMDELHRRGLFSRLGLSNFPAEQVAEWVAIAEEEGYVRPSVYQGQYNLICRGAEASLLPLLRRHAIALVAYSPLAGGFLSGKPTSGDGAAGSRFAAGDPLGQFFRGLYDRPQFHAALRRMSEFLAPREIALPEAALRWLYWHSQLGEGDGIILGASKTEQVETNTADIRKGPLPQEVVDALEEVWTSINAEHPT
ncbi:Aldo/keto reductase [Pleurostoma richardsiae]|uniref:Aldo/keto reductase n=1 Tax=Pleurostoma richardsiae TaxID=41990 RepID=A0AA38S352_9PEZI|nr:Aldo/keto reductase [Pleurostoma richardsiae]